MVRETPTPSSAAPRVRAGADGRDELRDALAGMLRSAKGMVTYTERALALLDGGGSRSARRLDGSHNLE